MKWQKTANFPLQNRQECLSQISLSVCLAFCISIQSIIMLIRTEYVLVCVFVFVLWMCL